METISPIFVLLLGMGTVFVGLICLIFLTMIMSAVLGKSDKTTTPATEAAKASAPAAAPVQDGIADRRVFDAAVAAAIATYMGDAPEGFRINSVKRV